MDMKLFVGEFKLTME